MANPNMPALILSSESSTQAHVAISNTNLPQPPSQLQNSMDGPVAILWDIENCPIPSDVRPEDVAGNIRMALRVHPIIQGAVTMFSAYGDFNAFPRRLREGCQRTGVKLIDVPNGRKDAADKAILVDMFLFALDNRPPSSIMLISGDVDFAPALHILGQRGYTVILVIPSGVGVSSALSNAGRFVWDWPSVVHGEGFVPPAKALIPPRGSPADFSGFLMGCQISDNPDGQNEEEAIVYRGISQSQYNLKDFSVMAQPLSEYNSTSISGPYFPTTLRSHSLPSGLNEVSAGPVAAYEQNDVMWVQPGDLKGLKGQLVKLLELSGGCMPLIRVPAEYQKIYGRPLYVSEYGSFKLMNLFKKMTDKICVDGKGQRKLVYLRGLRAGPSGPPSDLAKNDKKGKGTQEESIDVITGMGSSDEFSDDERVVVDEHDEKRGGDNINLGMANPTFSPFLLSTSSLLFISLIILCSLKEGKQAAAQSHLHSIHINSILPASVCNPSTKGPKNRASLKVVHKHGPCYKSTQVKTDAPSVSEILTHDQSRVKSINSRLAFNSAKNTLRSSKATLTAKSGSSLGAGNYIVTIGLGTPKKDLSLIFDTGSDLTWTQCQPCVGSCYTQQEPIFDPVKSSSYTNISCNSAPCTQLNSATGNRPGCSGSTCVYAIQYGDQSFSIGYLVKDRLYLTPYDIIDDFLFGCGENNQGLFGNTAGLIGLARDKLSITSQTSQKFGNFFSYCLPSKSSGTGYLSFGKSGVPSTVKYTPFASSQGTSFYFIDTLAIYVGGIKLPISTTVFSTAGTIIDSGTVITRLPPGAYTPLRDNFRQLMKKYPLGKPLSILDTCYDFSNYTTLLVPKIRFEFSGNTVDIDVTGILYVSSQSQTCLAFAPNSNESDVAIFGNVQQKTLEVVYDVAGGKLGFAAKGCA